MKRLLFLCAATLALLVSSSAASAQEEELPNDPATEAEAEATPEEEARAEQLREGAQVYSQICSSCHQPAGIGVSGQFPPLAGNPRIDDTDYVLMVINNGQQGELVVDGVTYDGVMPSFSTLTDDEQRAVVAYIQNGFVAPADTAQPIATGPVAGTELPALTNMGSVVAFLLAASVIALVLAPRVIGRSDRLDMPWLDAWLKTAVIVFGAIFLTVFVPDWVIRTDEVAALSQFAQELITVSLWLGGMAFMAWALWYAHRDSRI